MCRDGEEGRTGQQRVVRSTEWQGGPQILRKVALHVVAAGLWRTLCHMKGSVEKF